MANYIYEAVDNQGRRLKGSCQAADHAAAVRHCRQRQLYIISLVKERNYKLRRQSLSTSDQIGLFKRLATLLASGIALKDSLKLCLMEGNTANSVVVHGIVDELENGSSFAEALAKQKFSPFVCAMVQSGELSGGLEEVLTGIAARMEREKALYDRFWQTMFYPGVVGMVGVICFSVLLTVVLPAFCEVFGQLNADLPPLLRLLADLKEFISEWSAGCVAAFFCIVWLLYQGLHRSWFDALLLKIPWVGSYLLKRELIIMSGFTAMMLRSGMTLSAALEQQVHMSGNRCISRSWQVAREKIIGGSSFSQALQEDGIIPPLFIKFAAVGEASGKLDYMLERAADYYEQAMATQISWLSRIMEPLLLLIAGVFVLMLVLALLLPGFSLMDKIIL